jgi:hypothetical protein
MSYFTERQLQALIELADALRGISTALWAIAIIMVVALLFWIITTNEYKKTMW